MKDAISVRQLDYSDDPTKRQVFEAMVGAKAVEVRKLATLHKLLLILHKK